MKCIIKVVVILLLTIMLITIYLYVNRHNEKLSSLDVIDTSILSKGSSEMLWHKVVIVGIARDNIIDLPDVKRYIEYTGGFFKDYRVIIFENDSTDGTKWFLSKWKQKNHKVQIISQDYQNKKRPSIGFLATARNYYINELQHNPEYRDFDLVMMLDMDMSNGWDMRGVFDTFSKIDQWDAVCANGIWTTDGRMYDAFAFRRPGFQDSPAQNADYAERVVPMMQNIIYPVGGALVPVTSCFNGMAFYKKKFIQECLYTSPGGDCEHVMFNECLHQNGARIFMNPSQIIRYAEPAGKWFGVYPKGQKPLDYKIMQKIRSVKNALWWCMDILLK